jgi:hypothetical protein
MREVFNGEVKVLKRFRPAHLDCLVVDFDVVRQIQNQASQRTDVSMEQAEVVALALVDLGYAKLEEK